MKKILSVFAIFIFVSSLIYAQDLKLPRVSQKASVTQTIGLTDVTVSYSRPGVKKRTIWGDLVPYGKVWRTGANEATTVTFSDSAKINGQSVPAGTYSLHTVPDQAEWTVILNKQAEQWGSYEYDQGKDVLRVSVKPQQGPHQEWMQFAFTDVQQDSAVLELAWEKVRVPIKIEVDTMNQAMANIRDALSKNPTNWQVPYRAADFVVSSNAPNKDDAMKWIDQSVALEETYWNLRLKADLLAEQGKTEEAIAAAEKAVKIGKENKDEPSEIEKTEKKIEDWKAGSAS